MAPATSGPEFADAGPNTESATTSTSTITTSTTAIRTGKSASESKVKDKDEYDTRGKNDEHIKITKRNSDGGATEEDSTKITAEESASKRAKDKVNAKDSESRSGADDDAKPDSEDIVKIKVENNHGDGGPKDNVNGEEDNDTMDKGSREEAEKVDVEKLQQLDLEKLDVTELVRYKDMAQRRIHELAPVSTQRIGKTQDDVRMNTAHWAYLLQEMAWMAEDFKKERGWKQKQQKIIVKSALRQREKMFNKDLQNSIVMRKTAKKICAKVAREVRTFWEKVDRIVVYKYKTEFYARQQAAMDKHLNFLVDQTERYSNLLATKLRHEAQEDERRYIAKSPASSRTGFASERSDEGEEESGDDQDHEEDEDEDYGDRSVPSSQASSAGDALVDDQSSAPSQTYSSGRGRSQRRRRRTTAGFLENRSDDGHDQRENIKDDEYEIKARDSDAESRESFTSMLYKNSYKRPRPRGRGTHHSAANIRDSDEDEEEDWEESDAENAQDDETTIEKTGEGTAEDNALELEALRRESEMSREELLRLYGYPQEIAATSSTAVMLDSRVRKHGKDKQSDASGDEDNSDENEDLDWEGDEEEDNEETLDAEGEPSRQVLDSELDQLKAEGEMSLEELRAMYGIQAQAVEEDENPISRQHQSTSSAEMSGKLPKHKPNSDDESDSDIDFVAREEEDNEETLDQEGEQTATENKQELDDLREEAEMSVEELRRKYGLADETQSNHNSDSDQDFVAEDEEDNEETLEQEGEQTATENKQELDDLREEAEMSVEELRRKYGLADETQSNHNSDSDQDFVAEDEEDNEETLEQEGEQTAMENQKELDDLKEEADMSVEELRRKYGLVDAAPSSSINANSNKDDEMDSDQDYVALEEEDNEETLEAEGEQTATENKQELDDLQEEAEMSVEELRRKYGLADETQSNHNSDSDQDFEAEDEEDNEETLEEEGEQTAKENKQELDDLKEEAEMSVEELRRKYGLAGETRSSPAPSKSNLMSTLMSNQDEGGDDDDDEEFNFEEEEDEEETMEQEGEPDEAEAKRELADLELEANLSREELMRRYGYSLSESDEEADIGRSRGECEGQERNKGNNGLVTSSAAQPPQDDTDGQIRFQVPFLMEKDLMLREYQRLGLDWLVSMCERRLNGILADEMGLGKTVQTISLLAHLAAERGIWGPHLIIVPTSVLLNWEMEFKKFCPAFKVLTYYGTTKERKAKRVGWTQPNAFHACITSYQLAVQDAHILRRKKWFYMILDEAHNIKNFRSQRWQTLLTFNTKRRLLLTGTPLQNSLMELWSLMHFLMPHIFRSQTEFKYWFSNPLNAVVEGRGKASAAQAALARQEQDRHNAKVIKRLHTVIRPFLLRRLKADVATQLPGKYEHIVRVPLSRRQRFLYEDFISRSSTRKALTSGGYLGMMAILMKLRMVCNHPDIFEPRVIESPFAMEPLAIEAAACTLGIRKQIGASFCGSNPVAGLELDIGGPFGLATREAGHIPGLLRTLWQVDRVAQLRPPKKALIEVLSSEEFDVHDDRLDSMELSSEAQAAVDVERKRMREENLVERVAIAECADRRMNNVERLGPVYGEDLRRVVTIGPAPGAYNACFASQWLRQHDRADLATPNALRNCAPLVSERVARLRPVLEHFVFATPPAIVATPVIKYTGRWSKDSLNTLQEARNFAKETERLVRAINSPDPTSVFSAAVLHPAAVRLKLSFPDKMLVQYDCGKLQYLAAKLRDLKAGGHRVLIFTQMTKMLDILELFLNIHGHVYFRLDGATKVDARQRMMEKFNRDPRIFAFILSTRSGGLGINLTGADTVIFYDSDWNPSMDAQAQDRAHRIGQTRDVHIYRLISEHTIEENILIKANQKRELNKLSVEDGNFTVSSFLSNGGQVKDLLGIANNGDNEEGGAPFLDDQAPLAQDEIERAMADVEDESDKAAAARAQQEAQDDLDEFDESKPYQAPVVPSTTGGSSRAPSPTPSTAADSKAGGDGPGEDVVEGETEDGGGNGGVESAEAGMTQDQLKEIEARLEKVERLAITFRMYWFPVVDTLSARLEMQAMEEAQQQTWEMEKLEAEREEMEDDAEEELIMATDGSKFDVSSYHAAKNAITNAKRIRLMTGKDWHEYKTPFGRAYYHNRETMETTWEQPAILRAMHNIKQARRHGWSRLVPDVLVRVMHFLESPEERFNVGRACKRWLRASRHPTLHIWVSNVSDVLQAENVTNAPFLKDWISVGTQVETLYQSGEIWYPGIVTDVASDGTYEVTYTDGFVEPGLRRSMMRVDSGIRYNFINPEDEATSPYGVYSKHHVGRLGLGPRLPDPKQVNTLEEALSLAKPGQVIVLRAGLHRANTSKLSIKRCVRIVGERFFAEASGIRSRAMAVYAMLPSSPAGLTRARARSSSSGSADLGPALTTTMTASPTNALESSSSTVIRLKRQLSASSLADIKRQPKQPPAVEVIGVESTDNDCLELRRSMQTLEEKACEDDVQVRSPVAEANRKMDKHIMWAHPQQTAIECSSCSALTLDVEGQIMIQGIVVMQERALMKPEVKPFSSVCILGKTQAMFADCTISHMFGFGSAVSVCSDDVVAFFLRSTVCSASAYGLFQDHGALVMIASEVCNNGLSGIGIKEGLLLVERSRIHGNGESAVDILGASSVVRLQGNDLRKNGDRPIHFTVDMAEDLLSISNNLLGDKERRFRGEDPWVSAADRLKEWRAGLSQRMKRKVADERKARRAAAAQAKVYARMHLELHARLNARPKRKSAPTDLSESVLAGRTGGDDPLAKKRKKTSLGEQSLTEDGAESGQQNGSELVTSDEKDAQEDLQSVESRKKTSAKDSHKTTQTEEEGKGLEATSSPKTSSLALSSTSSAEVEKDLENETQKTELKTKTPMEGDTKDDGLSERKILSTEDECSAIHKENKKNEPELLAPPKKSMRTKKEGDDSKEPSQSLPRSSKKRKVGSPVKEKDTNEEEDEVKSISKEANPSMEGKGEEKRSKTKSKKRNKAQASSTKNKESNEDKDKDLSNSTRQSLKEKTLTENNAKQKVLSKEPLTKESGDGSKGKRNSVKGKTKTQFAEDKGEPNHDESSATLETIGADDATNLTEGQTKSESKVEEGATTSVPSGVEAPVTPVPIKRKRGRPPKSARATSATSSRTSRSIKKEAIDSTEPEPLLIASSPAKRTRRSLAAAAALATITKDGDMSSEATSPAKKRLRSSPTRAAVAAAAAAAAAAADNTATAENSQESEAPGADARSTTSSQKSSSTKKTPAKRGRPPSSASSRTNQGANSSDVRSSIYTTSTDKEVLIAQSQDRASRAARRRRRA